MMGIEEKHNEYVEHRTDSMEEELTNAIDTAKIDEGKLYAQILSGDEETEKPIDNFYTKEGDDIIFDLDQVKSYLDDVYKRLSGMKVQKFGEISKENNFTGTILAIQIALKAMSTNPKNPKIYNIGAINGEYNLMTKNAIKQFQADQRIEKDGKPGKVTIGKICESLVKLINDRKENLVVNNTENTNRSNFVEIDGNVETYTKVREIIDSALYFRPSVEFRLAGNEFTPYIGENEQKEEFARYIMQNKLGSGENPKMEKIYEEIMQENSDCSWKLEYIKEHRGKNISDIIKQIGKDENDKYMSRSDRPLEQERIDKLPNRSRNLIPKKGNIFTQGKNIFIKAIDGVRQYIGERVGGIDRIFKQKSQIKSSPCETNRETGVTKCSATAQNNANNFGLTIPSGHAKIGVYNPIIDKQHFVESKDMEPNNYIKIDQAAPLNANFADISVKSFTKNGIKFGHRAVAFLDTSNQRYVLDPYYSGGKGRNPIPLAEYPKRDLVERINYYNAPIQSQSA